MAERLIPELFDASRRVSSPAGHIDVLWVPEGAPSPPAVKQFDYAAWQKQALARALKTAKCGGEGGKPGPCPQNKPDVDRPARREQAKDLLRHVRREAGDPDIWVRHLSDIPPGHDDVLRNRMASFAADAHNLLRSTRATPEEKARAFDVLANEATRRAARMHRLYAGQSNPRPGAETTMAALRAAARQAHAVAAAIRSHGKGRKPG